MDITYLSVSELLPKSIPISPWVVDHAEFLEESRQYFSAIAFLTQRYDVDRNVVEPGTPEWQEIVFGNLNECPHVKALPWLASLSDKQVEHLIQLTMQRMGSSKDLAAIYITGSREDFAKGRFSDPAFEAIIDGTMVNECLVDYDEAYVMAYFLARDPRFSEKMRKYLLEQEALVRGIFSILPDVLLGYHPRLSAVFRRDIEAWHGLYYMKGLEAMLRQEELKKNHSTGGPVN